MQLFDLSVFQLREGVVDPLDVMVLVEACEVAFHAEALCFACEAVEYGGFSNVLVAGDASSRDGGLPPGLGVGLLLVGLVRLLRVLYVLGWLRLGLLELVVRVEEGLEDVGVLWLERVGVVVLVGLVVLVDLVVLFVSGEVGFAVGVHPLSLGGHGGAHVTQHHDCLHVEHGAGLADVALERRELLRELTLLGPAAHDLGGAEQAQVVVTLQGQDLLDLLTALGALEEVVLVVGIALVVLGGLGVG